MMFFTLRAGCTRSANYIKLVGSDVQPIANYYSFRWAPKIVRTLDDLRDPIDFERNTSCRGTFPFPEDQFDSWTPPAPRDYLPIANWSARTFESEAA